MAEARARGARAAAAAFAAAVVVHSWTLSLGFYADDYVEIGLVWLDLAPAAARPAQVRDAVPDRDEPVALALYRPVQDGIHRALILARGRDSRGVPAPPSAVLEHALSVLLHGLAAALVVLLAVRLGAGPGAALLGGLLFALHPATPETVGWIAARPDILWVVFGLGAFVALPSAVPAPGRSPVREGLRIVVAAGLGVLALHSKETGLGVVVLLAVVALFAALRRQLRWSSAILLVSLFAAGVAHWLLERSRLYGDDAWNYLGRAQAIDGNAILGFFGETLPRLLAMIGGGRMFGPSHGCFSFVLSPVAAVAVGLHLGLGLWKRPGIRRRVLVLLAIGIASAFPAHLVAAFEDNAAFARFVYGCVAALAVAVALAVTSTIRLVRVERLIFLLFVLLLARASYDLHSLDGTKRVFSTCVQGALHEAGPGADLVLVVPRSDPQPLLSPWWSIPLLMMPPFLERGGRTFRYDDPNTAVAAADPDSPERLLLSAPRPMVLAGYKGSLGILVLPGRTGTSPSRLSAGRHDPENSWRVEVPAGIPRRIYGTLAFEDFGSEPVDAEVVVRGAGGDPTFARFKIVLPAGGGLPRTLRLPLATAEWLLRDDLAGTACEIRLEALGSAVTPSVRNVALELEGCLPALSLSDTRVALEDGEPVINVRNPTGWAWLRLVWEVADLPEGPALTYTLPFPDGAGERVWTADSVTPGSPPPPFALLTEVRLRQLLDRSGSRSLRFQIRAEACAVPEGPTLATSLPAELRVVPRP